MLAPARLLELVRGCRIAVEGDCRANEGAEHGKPETCLHANYLKHSEIEISEIFEMT
jgi:hypothetical protein